MLVIIWMLEHLPSEKLKYMNTYFPPKWKEADAQCLVK